MKWIGLCLLILMVYGSTAAQDAPVSEIDPALEAQMLELEAWTEEHRELSASEPVGHAFPTRAEVQAYIEEQYRKELTPELAQRSLAFYAALELLPPDTDLTQLFIDVLGSQVAGYYDSDTGAMNVVPFGGEALDGELSLLDQITYVHEYTHALQDQNFDLDNFVGTDELEDHPDQSLAALALVEGDATLTMTTYMQEIAFTNPAAVMSLFDEGLDVGSLMPPDDVPDALIRELLFPYESGLVYTLALYADGGWAAIDDAFRNPPTTSEQILHPEAYLAGESAQAVELAPIDTALGEGWELTWDTALGEFYLGEHLHTQLDDEQASEAAAGWGGDHFVVYTNADREIVWLLKLAWDTPEDATEFAAAYSEFLTARSETIDARATATCSTAETVICANVDSSVIVGAPDEAQALALLQTQMG